MVHCGFEPTAVNDAVSNPLKAAWVAMRGPRIVNVLANGVGDFSLKRAQYTAVIRNNGVRALFQRVEQQVCQLTDPHTGG